ncbi:ion channel [Aeromonas veronii]|uniref:ion channel n=1 Tax=Aeromonas veronii TaxID=654 RepID=UPI003D24785D
MQNGFIHYFFDALMKTGRYLNAVEYFKKTSQFFYLLRAPDKHTDSTYLRQAANIGIDIFIVLKWLFIAFLWALGINHAVVTVIVWYLLISNVFTYFDYHAWNLSPSTPETTERSQRRFLTVLLSMGYTIFCYAYFYGVVYFANFNWGAHSSTLDMIYFSVANALTVTYGDVSLLDTTARLLCASQLSVTFIFVLIIASSIPTKNIGEH